MLELKPGRYFHYKHPEREYQLIGIARHTETMEEMVVYKPLYQAANLPPAEMWVRPKEMFTGEVEVEGRKVPRFTYRHRIPNLH